MSAQPPEKIISRIRVKLFTNAQRDPVDLTSKLFDKIISNVALEEHALICTNWKYNPQTFTNVLLTHANMIEMFFNYSRFAGLVLNDATPMQADDTENSVLTHNITIMLDVLFPMSIPGVKSVKRKSDNSSFSWMEIFKKTLFNKKENTFLKIGSKTQTVDNVIWLDTFVSNSVHFKAKELTKDYFSSYLPKAIDRLKTMYADALKGLPNQVSNKPFAELINLLTETKKTLSGAKLKQLNEKLTDYNTLLTLQNKILNFKKTTANPNSFKTIDNAKSGIITFIETPSNNLNWATHPPPVIGNFDNFLQTTNDFSTAITTTQQNNKNYEKIITVLNNLKEFNEIATRNSSVSYMSNRKITNLEDLKNNLEKEIKAEQANEKDDKLSDIDTLNETNLKIVDIRGRLVKANSLFQTQLNNYDKAVLKGINEVYNNPFAQNNNFKNSIDTVKKKYDELNESFYKDLPEFKKLRKNINIGYLLTRIFHYKDISSIKTKLNLIQEDLNRPEFIFYDKMVEGFRDFYYPTRQYLNPEINKIFMEDDEVDIFELRDLIANDKKLKDPQGIDQINFLSKNPTDPKYEISLSLTVFGGTLTKETPDSAKCVYGFNKSGAELEQRNLKAPIQEYFDITEKINSAEKDATKKNSKKKEKPVVASAAVAAAPTGAPVQAPAAAPAPAVAATAAAPAASVAIKKISEQDYENEINRLMALIPDKKKQKTKFVNTSTDLMKELNKEKATQLQEYFSFVEYLKTHSLTDLVPGQNKGMTNRDYYKKILNSSEDFINGKIAEINLELDSDAMKQQSADKRRKKEYKLAFFSLMKEILDVSSNEISTKIKQKGGKRRTYKKKPSLRKSRRTKRRRQ